MPRLTGLPAGSGVRGMPGSRFSGQMNPSDATPVAPPNIGGNGIPARKPLSVEELTDQNVKAIAALEQEVKNQLSRTDRVAGKITRFCGSMAFVWLHVVWFGGWVVWNITPGWTHVDPYPFSFLTLVVSLEAIFLSTFIMISENRQAYMDERRSHLDLQINLLAEQENTKMLELLEKIAAKLEIDISGDLSVAVLKEATRPDKLIAQIDESAKAADTDDEAESASKGTPRDH